MYAIDIAVSKTIKALYPKATTYNVQRSIFLLNHFRKIDTKLNYSIYQYAPYSFLVADLLSDLVQNGEIARIGSSYISTMSSLSGNELAISEIANFVSIKNATDIQSLCCFLHFSQEDRATAVAKSKIVLPNSINFEEELVSKLLTELTQRIEPQVSGVTSVSEQASIAY